MLDKETRQRINSARQILVGKVNVDDNRTLANKYGIMNIPTMILFKNGEKIHQFVSQSS